MPGAVVEIAWIARPDQILAIDLAAIEPELSQLLEVVCGIQEIAILIDVELVTAPIHGSPPCRLKSQRSSARQHRGPSALLANQWKTRCVSPRKNLSVSSSIFFKIRVAASAAEADCDAAAATSSGTRLVLSLVAQQVSRN
jgi:hypothetical protein